MTIFNGTTMHKNKKLIFLYATGNGGCVTYSYNNKLIK